MPWKKIPGTNMSQFVVDGIRSDITGKWLVKPKRVVQKKKRRDKKR